MKKVLYVGLDVHKDTIAVAVAEDSRGEEVRFHGTINNSADAVLRLTKTLTAKGSVPTFCYEAGPCAYGLHRHLTKLGFECAVVAPSMIPRKTGDRVKTDQRDAEMLARLWRAGELAPIWTPDEEQEAMRFAAGTNFQAKNRKAAVPFHSNQDHAHFKHLLKASCDVDLLHIWSFHIVKILMISQNKRSRLS